MRYIAIFIAIAIALWVGNFAYTLWMRPIDQPTQELRELEAHFNRLGIVGHIYPVRHGFGHSKVKAVAAFEIKGYALPFGLTACSTEQEATIRSAPNPDLPQELQPSRNGKIVLEFLAWGDDTFPVAQSVKQAFLSYRVSPNNSFKPKPLRGSA